VALAEIRAFARGAAGAAAGLDVDREWRGDAEAAARGFERRIEAARRLGALGRSLAASWPAAAREVFPGIAPAPELWGGVLAWAGLEALGRAVDPDRPGRAAARLFDALRLREPIARALMALGLAERSAWPAVARIRAGFAHAAAGVADARDAAPGAFAWVHDPDVAWAIGVHEHEGVRYFVQEPFERLLWWLALPALLTLAAERTPDPDVLRDLERQIARRAEAARVAGYRVESLLDSGPAGTPSSV
jgi:hypothetical protein